MRKCSLCEKRRHVGISSDHPERNIRFIIAADGVPLVMRNDEVTLVGHNPKSRYLTPPKTSRPPKTRPQLSSSPNNTTNPTRRYLPQRQTYPHETPELHLNDGAYPTSPLLHSHTRHDINNHTTRLQIQIHKVKVKTKTKVSATHPPTTHLSPPITHNTSHHPTLIGTRTHNLITIYTRSRHLSRQPTPHTSVKHIPGTHRRRDTSRYTQDKRTGCVDPYSAAG
jgi:hypothetical protein